METINNPYLIPSSANGFKLGATTGKEIITNQKDLFSSIGPDFKQFGLDRESKPTKEVEIMPPYEIIKNGTFKQVFEGFDISLEKLYFTMSQIICMVKKNKDSLASNFGSSFFLTRKHKNFILIIFIFLYNLFNKENKKDYYKYFVVHVHVYPDGLYVRVNRFENDHVWDARYQHRVVVPQLIS